MLHRVVGVDQVLWPRSADLGRVDGHDAAEPLAEPQLLHDRRPQARGLVVGQGPRRPVGVDPTQEQRLGPVDVADAGDDLLVEQRGADRDRAAAQRLPEPQAHVAAIPQRVRPEPGEDLPLALGVEQLAHHRPRQIHGCPVGAQRQACGRGGRRDINDSKRAETSRRGRGGRGGARLPTDHANRPHPPALKGACRRHRQSSLCPSSRAAPSANRPCGEVTATTRPPSASRWHRASRWTVCPSGIVGGPAEHELPPRLALVEPADQRRDRGLVQ